MTWKSWPLVAALVGAFAGAGWLYLENRSLRAELADARASSGQRIATKTAPASLAPVSGQDETVAEEEPRTETSKSRPAWGFGEKRERPAAPEEAPEETREQRRKRRQAEIMAIFGRFEDETADEYRERMAPFVEMTLSRPRGRLADARAEAERAAGVSEAQRTELDTAFQDAYTEALTLTNRALESGDLTPYSRNWSGVLNVAGGLGAVLESTESRIGQILTPEQMQTIYEQGFEWGEYLGVSVPWEQLDAPPPPPGG